MKSRVQVLLVQVSDIIDAVRRLCAFHTLFRLQSFPASNIQHHTSRCVVIPCVPGNSLVALMCVYKPTTRLPTFLLCSVAVSPSPSLCRRRCVAVAVSPSLLLCCLLCCGWHVCGCEKIEAPAWWRGSGGGGVNVLQCCGVVVVAFSHRRSFVVRSLFVRCSFVRSFVRCCVCL